MKHLSTRKNKKGLWVLYILSAIAVVLAIAALVRTIGNLNLDAGDKDTSSPSMGGTTAPGGQSSPSTDSGGETEPTEATQTPADGPDTLRAALLEQCEAMLKSYYYDEVVTLIAANPQLENDETAAMAQKALELKSQLVLYEGEQLYHVFFHSLIIDTDKAFDGDYDANGYNEYMTTRYEFEKMLPLFLENGFILYDIKEMVQFDENGKASRKEIYLPPGKKPLVISIDDVCYYEYMKDDGFADRLDVDADGNVVTIVLDENGNDTVTYDGDVMPILDAFVRQHPEFSYKGYKGIVAVTGYQGVFGYRITDLDLIDKNTGKLVYDSETAKWMQRKVTEVADALRATGWDIACHSYTHNQYWSKGTITEADYNKYEKRWNEEVAPYIGECRIFISPNGAYANLGQNHFAFRRLVESGFTIYCPVGSGMATTWQNDNMLQDRMNLDGLNMIKYPGRVEKFFFDPKLVLDPARPPLK